MAAFVHDEDDNSFLVVYLAWLMILLVGRRSSPLIASSRVMMPAARARLVGSMSHRCCYDHDHHRGEPRCVQTKKKEGVRRNDEQLAFS